MTPNEAISVLEKILSQLKFQVAEIHLAQQIVEALKVLKEQVNEKKK